MARLLRDCRRLAPLMLAIGAFAAGCGGEADTDKTPAPGRVVATYYDSAQDPKAQCATLSKASLSQFGAGGAKACERRTIPSTQKPRGVRVEKELVRGDRACVRFRVVGGGVGIALLAMEGAEWKMNGFDNGAEPALEAARRCQAPGGARGPGSRGD